MGAPKSIKNLMAEVGGRLVFASTKYLYPWLINTIGTGVLKPGNIEPSIKLPIKLGIGTKEMERNETLSPHPYYKDGPDAYELRWPISFLGGDFAALAERPNRWFQSDATLFIDHRRPYPWRPAEKELSDFSC